MPEYYSELDKDFKQKVADYFDPWVLAEYLGITTEELIEAFEELVMEKQEDLEELMGMERE